MRKRQKQARYSFQFKHTAVRKSNHPEIQAIDVAAALDIHPVVLYRWRRDMQKGNIEENGIDKLSGVRR